MLAQPRKSVANILSGSSRGWTPAGRNLFAVANPEDHPFCWVFVVRCNRIVCVEDLSLIFAINDNHMSMLLGHDAFSLARMSSIISCNKRIIYPDGPKWRTW